MVFKRITVLLLTKIYTKYKRGKFKMFGRSSIIRPYTDLIVGEQYIEVGNNTILGKNVQLTAWDSNNGKSYTPQIIIGSNCQFGGYNHITAINRIEIGDGVLTGKFVTISDNSHGITDNAEELNVSPVKRPAYSKGAVEIGDNVWIGDKATILSNVKIGSGSIIGANSVVTKDIPPFSIVGGNPARIIKSIKQIQNINNNE